MERHHKTVLLVMHAGLGEVSPALAQRRGVDHRALERIVSEAIDLGIDRVGVDLDRDAHRLVGGIVKQLRARDRVAVTTRVPLAGFAGTTAALRLPPGHVRHEVDELLRATQLDALPLVFLPVREGWDGERMWSELLDTCARLVREGKVLAWGAWLDAPEAPIVFDTISVSFALCARGMAPVIAAAAARKIAVHVREPLAGGTLGGTIAPGALLGPRDDRTAIEEPALEAIAVGIARLAALVSHEPPAASACPAARSARAQAKRPELVECATVGELALRWAIGVAGVTCVVPRVHRREHVLDVLACAVAPPLSPALRTRLDGMFVPA